MEGPVDWSVKVELFEQIRREYEFGVGTVLGVARKLGAKDPANRGHTKEELGVSDRCASP